MNERNVEALALILRELGLGIEESGAGVPELEMADCRYCAELLASRGVLVPSALDDDELDLAGIRVHPQEYDPWSQVRSALERLAKGEQ